MESRLDCIRMLRSDLRWLILTGLKGFIRRLYSPHHAPYSQPLSKLDRRILPAFWVLYFLCSAIRSNIGHDLGSVLNITPKQVSTGLALFYVCYVIFDLPSNLIMSRVSPHAWMSRIVTCVGIIGMCLTAMNAAWNL
jgi:hypothetical protein